MKERILTITEKTLMPLSLVAVLVSVTSWVTSLHGELHAHGDLISEIRSRQEVYIQALETINERLARIEGKIMHHE